MEQIARLGRTGMRIPVGAGRIALGFPARVIETARAAGIPLPKPIHERLQDQHDQAERLHARQKIAGLGNLFLEVLIQERRGEPSVVDSRTALDILQSAVDATDVTVDEVMDPHATEVIVDAMQKASPEDQNRV